MTTENTTEKKDKDTRLSYERWSIKRLAEEISCRVEKGMTCIPLRTDPICRQCFEDEREIIENNVKTN